MWVEDPSVAIDLYRLRGLIEQGFDQLKNQLPGRRLRVTEASHLGKLLVYLIGCDLRLQIGHNLMLQQERRNNWKMELPEKLNQQAVDEHGPLHGTPEQSMRTLAGGFVAKEGS